MEAARETSRHDHKTWGLNTLRTKPISFVSAGPIEPLKQLEDILGQEVDEVTEQASTSLLGPPSPEEPGENPLADNCHEKATMDDAGEVAQPVDDPARIHEEEVAATSFFFDVKKSQVPTTVAQQELGQDRPSSRQSDSSEEVILFKGRDSRPRAYGSDDISMTHMRQEIKVVESQISAEVHNTISVSTSRKKKTKSQHRRDQRPPKRTCSHDDAMIADYIENMRENGEEDVLLQLVRNQQDIGGSDYIPSSDEEDGKANHVDTPPKDNDPEIDKDNNANNVLDAEGTNVSKSRYQSESELDDETLAQLLAGHELGQNPNPFGDIASEDSDSSEEPARWVDDLDFMDWERPSLRPKKKGKGAKARIQIDVSDSELEQTLQAAWKNDRFKKAERKRQREEMRALGQLGRNAKPEDLRVKYPTGMTVEEVAEEMRVFLQSTSET